MELAQDYNSSRSNKPSTRAADIGDGDPDSDGDGIDDAIETAQDYNSSRSNKPRTETPGDDRDGNSEIVHNATALARMVNPAGTIISVGPVMMSTNPDNPLYQETREIENPLYEGQANDGDSGDSSKRDSTPVQRFNLQPSSYCVDLSSNSQQGMRVDAQSHNSSRSNRTEGVPGQQIAPSQTKVIVVGITDNGDILPSEEAKQRNAGLNIDSDADGIPDFQDTDSDGDGLMDAIESATYSISKRSARTGQN